MAIIYSYPKQSSLQNTDLLIGTRFSTEPGVVPRSISFSLETLGEYINANHPLTLNQVLTAGNVSLLNASIGTLGLWDNQNGGYAIIGVGDSGFTFYDYIGDIVASIDSSGISIKANSFTGVIATSAFTADRQYTMPNKSGTIALTNDLSSLTLDQVLDNGNTSLNNAFINELGLYDFTDSKYWGLVVDDGTFFIYDINAAESMLETDGRRITLYGNYASSINNDALTANRDYSLPNKSGTIALTNDIPAALLTANYGLAAQIDSSTNIVNTTSELTLISNEYEGTLSVPANSFAVGDSFKVSLMGHINCLNSATLRIRIKTSAGVLLADTGVIDLEATTAKHWKLDIEFTIRQIGGEGFASIVSGGSFSYNKNASNNPESITFISINNSDFDTTISNALAITAQWNNANSSNAIYSDIFTLNKVY